jgi:hypothetical protein
VAAPGAGMRWLPGCGSLFALALLLLDAALSRRPRLAWAGAFVGGLGLLVASVFVFFWWWVIGAALLTATLLAAALVAAGRDGVRARSRGSDGTSGWVRWLWSANPVAKATSAIAVPAASRCLASRSRTWRRGRRW